MEFHPPQRYEGETVVSAYSGGLDSTFVMILLREVYGFKEIIPVFVDVGQGEEEVETALERAGKLGLSVEFFDSKREFAEDYIFRCIKANGSYEGYPIGTSMTRVLITTKCVEVAKKRGAKYLAHGCTGKGNDQFRIEFAAKYLDPEITVVAPVRELNLSREIEMKMLEERGITAKPRRGKLGGDLNMWSHSMGSGQIEDLESQYPEDYIWTVPPAEAPDEAEEIVVDFERGVPSKLGDLEDPVEIIFRLNEVGGKHGVGRIDILEDGMLGLKSREIYEAPAATILLKAHADLEGLTLTKEQLRFKREVDRIWAEMVYHAMWFHPLKRDFDAFIDSTQQHVGGKIRLKLYKGNVEIVGRESSSSLFSPEMRSIRRAGFDQRDSTGAAKIMSLLYQLLGKLKR